jgi:hypothetical protein
VLAAPMARLQQKSRRQSPQVRAEQPAFPARWLYGLYVVSSVTMLGCHRRPRDARGVFTNLAPASERQDHTTSPYVADVIRLLTRRVHRIPQPTFVTIAKRPSARSRDARQGACDLPDKASALPAACWRDGQITHDAHAQAARRVVTRRVAIATSDAERNQVARCITAVEALPDVGDGCAGPPYPSMRNDHGGYR